MSPQSTFPMISATEEVNCGIGSECKITLTCNNRRFIVLLSRCPFLYPDKPNSIEYTHLNRLDDALKSKNPLEVDTTIEEISDFVATLCQPTCKEFASTIGDESQELDLDFCIMTYNLQLITVDGKPKVIRCKSNGNGIIQSTFSGLLVQIAATHLNLPNFAPKQVKVLEKYKGTNIMKVSAQGRVMCCKIADDRTRFAIDRELRCLQQISAAGLDPPLRIPKLCGIIRSGNDRILGILITNISPNSETPRFGLVDVSMIVIARRKKWASQIKATIEKLHDVGGSMG